MLSNFTLNTVISFLSSPYNAVLLAIFIISGIILMLPDSKKFNIKAEDITQRTTDKNTNTIMVDIRESTQKRLPKSKSMNIVELAKSGNLAKQLKNKNDIIIIISEGQKDGLQALKILKSQEYTNVFILEKGVDGWINAGLPLATSSAK
ncbi:MAG: hypothetical protein RLZZ210_1103 [Pseudomonadota bacterium]|jgi:rhodanese-related sulfurtransferase